MSEGATVQPINSEHWRGQAIRLLAEGFPKRPIDFWEQAFEGMVVPQGAWPGYLIVANGSDAVGVLLLVYGSRERDGTCLISAGLSSLYVREGFRVYAPKLIQEACRQPGKVYVAATARAAVRRLYEVLGFKKLTDGMYLTSIGFNRNHDCRARVSGFSPGTFPLSASDARLLEDHARLGCLTAVIEAENAITPLVLYTKRLWRMPVAALVLYCGNRQLLNRNLASVHRYLLSVAATPFLLQFVRADERPANGIRLHDRYPLYVRCKDSQLAEFDHAYSEFVWLKL